MSKAGGRDRLVQGGSSARQCGSLQPQEEAQALAGVEEEPCDEVGVRTEGPEADACMVGTGRLGRSPAWRASKDRARGPDSRAGVHWSAYWLFGVVCGIGRLQ